MTLVKKDRHSRSFDTAPCRTPATADGIVSSPHSMIEAKFGEWQLTTTEKDISELILKGCSMREIAQSRNRSEETIRQQAQVIYSKSNLSGRAEFSAYFLEILEEAFDAQ